MKKIGIATITLACCGICEPPSLQKGAVFSNNRNGCLRGIGPALLSKPKPKALMSDEHFSVDKTLTEASARR